MIESAIAKPIIHFKVLGIVFHKPKFQKGDEIVTASATFVLILPQLSGQNTFKRERLIIIKKRMKLFIKCFTEVAFAVTDGIGECDID